MGKTNDYLAYIDICPVCRWTTTRSETAGHRTDCAMCKDKINKDVPQIQIELRIPGLLLGDKSNNYPLFREKRKGIL
ncbi:MAG: hypothetical protein LWX08_16390 [Deltaproteobacteria bacterium]|jgi:hypothetical protein|nr:hypothetical protein [Deltaproteobacteria bacterium]